MQAYTPKMFESGMAGAKECPLAEWLEQKKK
jgi:hypothetical protein